MESKEELQKVLKWRQELGGFNRYLGAKITDITEGGATVALKLIPEMLNPLSMAHGGALFSLCDIAAGTAAASRGRVAVTLDSSIQYLRAAKPEQTIRAQARELKSGRNTAVYMVEVTDESGKLLTTATFTMFYTDKTIEDLVCEN